MPHYPTLQEIDNQVLLLLQSTIGAITPNFRMITLSFDDPSWIIEFYFEKEDPDDLDEVDEILGQYGAYQNNELEYKHHLHFGTAPIYIKNIYGNDKSLRIVYKRKEE